MTTTAEPVLPENAGAKLAAFTLAASGAIVVALAFRTRSRDLAAFDDDSSMAAASGLFGGIHYGPPDAPSLAGPLVMGGVGAMLLLMAFVVMVGVWTRR